MFETEAFAIGLKAVTTLEVGRSVDVLEQLDDGQLIRLIHQGDTEALEYLIRKYKSFVYSKTRTYFLIGSDREDVIQEGMIGLYKAILDYKEDKLSSFKRFAELCITRQIITSIKTATRQKHLPLNSYVSLDKPIYDEESERTLLDIIVGSDALDPQELLLSREKYKHIQTKLINHLSLLERNVLNYYLSGCTYEEIAHEIGRHVKSVDNALQRVKKKLEQLIIKNELSLY